MEPVSVLEEVPVTRGVSEDICITLSLSETPPTPRGADGLLLSPWSSEDSFTMNSSCRSPSSSGKTHLSPNGDLLSATQQDLGLCELTSGLTPA